MTAIDLLWHLGNLLALALGVGLLSAALAKLVWRKALGTVGWWRLAKWAVLTGWLGLLIGLLWTGRDGRMAVHALTLAGIAIGLWWAGFVRPSRR